MGQDDMNVLRLAYTNALSHGGKKNSIDAAIINYVDDSAEATGDSLGEKVAEIPFNFEKATF